jgi:biopolymer transport protein ExbD
MIYYQFDIWRRRHMARRAVSIIRARAESAQFAPIATINTTPLIDMMLVILIMVIVAIPLRHHKVPLDLPTNPTGGAPPPAHTLTMAREGRLAWDGQPLTDAALAPRLSAMVADPAPPLLRLAIDGEARYARVDQLLATIRGAGVTRLGMVGNRDFAARMDD